MDDTDIVDWALMGSIQTFFVIQADGSGIPLTGDMLAGPVIGKTRDDYHAVSVRLTARLVDRAQPRPLGSAKAGELCWVQTDTSSDSYRMVAAKARERWGFVPNLITAVSRGRSPDLSLQPTMSLELLERPQGEALSSRLHAMVRALVASLDRCDYSAATIRQQLLDSGADEDAYQRIPDDWSHCRFGPADQLVLDFAAKVARNAYKIVPGDAQNFREAGLAEEAYVEVFATVAIQLGIDRVSHGLGVLPDERPVLKS